MREDLQAFLSRARATRASSALAEVIPLDELRSALQPAGDAQFSFEALRGRFIEISTSGSSAVLSATMGLVLEAQLAAEPVAWVTPKETCFYPPDVVECGVDLSAIVVIRATDAVGVGKAAERLLRSTAFGLVILDLGAPDWVIERGTFLRSGNQAFSMANQGRLVSLANKSESLVVCITNRNASSGSLSSLTSLRADAARERDVDGLSVALRVLKDKRHGPGWTQRQRAKGPAGLT